ncbi:auxilin-related protein 1-like isoform X1 [Phoenix dactylifera]|uniref:Auxilin-related protein 1-like isoform X1 n=1 Tax=Phoenix dactylifera TaxID=42345 RepID=A0A8B8J832_PHODC|nr:auxilin-related protein 1-like isoform X1 [Phoenix dactylifera]
MDELAPARLGGRASAGRSKKAAGGFKKAASGAAEAAKSAYDDVFGGPPRYAVPFAARLDDYSEIFAGLADSCSIPVLDLPLAMGSLDDAPVDARGSSFDYAEIFRGFDGGELAVPYQELFAEPKKEEISSSNEWEQRSTGFDPQVKELSEFPPKYPNGDNVACPEEDQFSSNSNHSDDGSKQFNMSYNKMSRGNMEDAISERTHVTQLHAVPRFKIVVDGCDPLQNNTSDNSLDMVNDEMANLDQGRKVPPSSSGDSTKSAGSDLKSDQKLYATKLSASQNGHAKVKQHLCSSSDHSTSMEDVSSAGATYLTISDISLQTKPLEVPPPSRTPPSRPPPKLFNKQGHSAVKMYANSRTDLDEVKPCKPISNHQTRYGVASSKSHAHQESVKDHSPSIFDVEVDASSAAAASAVAMKKAMELAQARLKSAKESMGRKHDNLQSRKKLGQYEAIKCMERKVENASQEVESFGEMQTQKTVVREDKKINGVGSEERHVVISATKIALGYEEKERHVVSAKESQPSMQGNEFKSSAVSQKLENDSGKWKTDKEFYELINDEKKDKMARETSKQYIIAKNTKETTMISENKENINKDAGWAYEFTRIRKLGEDTGNNERAENIMKLKDGKITCREGETKVVRDMIPEACVHEEEKSMLEEDQVPDQEENENLGEVQEPNVHEEEVKKQYISEKAAACGESEKASKPSDAACKFEGNYASENEERKLDAAKEACKGEDNEKKLSTTVPFEHEDNLNVDWQTVIQDEIDKEIEVPHGQAASQYEDSEEARIKGKVECCHGGNGHRSEETWVRLEQEESKIVNATPEACLCMWERGEKMEADQAAGQCEDSEKARFKGKVECCYAGNGYRSEVTWVRLEQEESKKVNGTHEACFWAKNELKQVAPEADKLEGGLKKHKTAIGAMGHEEQEKKTGLAKKACWQNRKEMKTPDARPEFIQNDKKQEGDQALLQLENEQAVFENGQVATRSEDVKEVRVAPDIMEEVKKLNGARDVFQRDVGTVMEDVRQASFLAEKGNIPSSPQVAMESSAWASNGTGEDVRQASLLSKKCEIPSSPQDAMVSSVLASDNTANTANNLHKTGERKNGRRIERETDRVKEQARILEEERGRGRERKKNRVAVERATREAHEKAFAEARERAERIAVERVTAEARQRALAEAREKAEKASLEAQERSLAEKALREARLRAERATAEAPERAVERALAEQAASEARACMERFNATASYKMRKDNVADDHLKARNKDMQDVAHGAQFQSTNSSSTCQRYSDFSMQAEGESNLRYKARLERHQRTIERAAKALAEKHMHDLLAQKEQAERNRLAEYLDIEVKRWSNGKEGNLRALLSTLQYILGPESGWQPIPLTDVITAAAVKKAYRKATLWVHPDKLQQRGASIQQKYICEKVYDLLKEAWNRFTSEER